MGLVETFVGSCLGAANKLSAVESFLLTVTILVLTCAYIKNFSTGLKKGEKLPPTIFHLIPFIGSAVSFGKQPVTFLLDAYKTYGQVFTFTMFGEQCTYLVGSEAASLFLNSKNDELNAEDVYGSLTIPVFGKGVGYDVPHKELCEQKRLSKLGLTITRFQEYVGLIEEETVQYMKRYKGEGTIDFFHCMSELVIMTASRCLLGKEIRDLLDESVADLYHDLDKGFTPEAWLLPSWLPLPSFIVRDKAHKKISKLFRDIVAKRRKEPEKEMDTHNDLMHTYMTIPYKNGTYMKDHQVAHMCIALLMAGQHTSSTTAAWLGYFFCTNEEYRNKARDEVGDLMNGDTHLTYDKLKEMNFLDMCLKETLRLRPPLVTVMRKVRKPQKINGYTIPVGHNLCLSPAVNHIIDEDWNNPLTYNPYNFKQQITDTDASVENVTSKENHAPVADGSDDEETVKQMKGADGHVYSNDYIPASRSKYSYIPFGAGRHRCIGESFAILQIKTIFATLLREFEFERKDLPDIDVTTLIHVPKNGTVKYKRIQTL